MNIPSNNPSVRLTGTIGKYELGTNNVRVNYLQSTVGINDSHQMMFIDSLKPLREHLEINQIKDLNDILQRDISDKRVASGIIPYILNLNDIDLPKFFPSIVVVLIPENTFGNNEAIYPVETQSQDEEFFKRDYKNWSVDTFKGDDGQPSNIAILNIDPTKTIPLVIDGQHRAAAFKYLTNKSNFAGENAIYKTFYDDTKYPIPEDFNSQLPVTIVWFDHKSSSNIDVKDFSRKIFLDINQSSQSISLSRKILLDSDQPAGFLTRIFYNIMTQRNQFSAKNGLSLFFSGFDYPYDNFQGKESNKQSIFNPELFAYALEWLLFTNDTYDNLSKSTVSREEKSKDNTAHFNRYLENSSSTVLKEIKDLWDKGYKVINRDRQEELEKIFTNNLGNALYEIINICPYYKPIFEAFGNIQSKFDEDREGIYTSPTHRLIWTKVFRGGEGLYYEFNDEHTNSTSKNFKRCIVDIEGEFMKEYAEINSISKNEANVLYKKITSKAFIVGYINTIKFLTKKLDKTPNELVPLLEKAFESVELSVFNSSILTLSKDYIKDISPKSWPSFRNIILRCLSAELDVYDHPELESLERQVYLHIFINLKLNLYVKEQSFSLSAAKQDISQNKFELIHKDKFEAWKEDSYARTQQIFEPIFDEVFQEYSRDIKF